MGVRLAFLGSAPFAAPVLRHLLDCGRPPCVVVTPPDRPKGRGRRLEPSPVAAMAADAGIDLLQPSTTTDPEFVKRLDAYGAEVFLVASYGELLRDDVLGLPSIEFLNVHPSLLPRHRGATPVQGALLAGDPVTGVSIMRVVPELDAGPVAVALETRVEAEETAGELAARLATLGGEAAVLALQAMEDGSIHFEDQDPLAVSMTRRLEKTDGRIDWSSPATDLARFVRAMNPWPRAHTAFPGGGDLALLRAASAVGSGTPGEVLATGEQLLVATGEGALAVTEIQAPGRRAMPSADWLRGSDLKVGDIMGATA